MGSYRLTGQPPAAGGGRLRARAGEASRRLGGGPAPAPEPASRTRSRAPRAPPGSAPPGCAVLAAAARHVPRRCQSPARDASTGARGTKLRLQGLPCARGPGQVLTPRNPGAWGRGGRGGQGRALQAGDPRPTAHPAPGVSSQGPLASQLLRKLSWFIPGAPDRWSSQAPARPSQGWGGVRTPRGVSDTLLAGLWPTCRTQPGRFWAWRFPVPGKGQEKRAGELTPTVPS